jgi:hypothetical protein
MRDQSGHGESFGANPQDKSVQNESVRILFRYHSSDLRSKVKHSVQKEPEDTRFNEKYLFEQVCGVDEYENQLY